MWIHSGKDKPVDAVIMAIVDRLDVELPESQWEETLAKYSA